MLSRALLERLERLSLEWQQSFRGAVGGKNLSRFPGAGQDFLDHRSFYQGDDLRAVNWRAYLRFDRLFLKVFQMEPRVPVRILLDGSASMDVLPPAASASKFHYARQLTAAFVYVGLVRLDSMSIQSFSSRLHNSWLASGGRHHFHQAEKFLRAQTPGGRTDLRSVVREFLNRYRQPGLAIVLSDFMLPDMDLRPLEYLADFGHELWLLHLSDNADRDPPDRGQMELLDAETGQLLAIDVDEHALAAYRQAFSALSASLNRVAGRTGGRYWPISTDVPLDQVLFSDSAERIGMVPRH